MRTNFFETIAGLQITGGYLMNITTHADNNMTVSVMLSSEKAGDNAAKVIPPMLFIGTPQELDEGFFASFSDPVKATAQLFANMENYQKGLDKAKEQSKIELDKKNKSAKAKSKTGATDNADTDDTDDDENETLFTQPLDDKLKKEERKQAYDALMKQVGELNTQCKYEEAITLMPTAGDYPEKAEEITRKLAELHKRKAMYDELKKDF